MGSLVHPDSRAILGACQVRFLTTEATEERRRRPHMIVPVPLCDLCGKGLAFMPHAALLPTR